MEHCNGYPARRRSALKPPFTTLSFVPKNLIPLFRGNPGCLGASVYHPEAALRLRLHTSMAVNLPFACYLVFTMTGRRTRHKLGEARCFRDKLKESHLQVAEHLADESPAVPDFLYYLISARSFRPPEHYVGHAKRVHQHLRVGEIRRRGAAHGGTGATGRL